MRIIETKVYQYDELPTDKAKERAREWFDSVQFGGYDWWESVYEDAERIGLKIKSFDERTLEAEFMASAEETAHKIEAEHGDKCETFIDAKEYLEARDKVVNEWERDENGEFVNQDRLDVSLDALDSNFLYALREDYRISLQKDLEYMQSTEQIEENIRANEYEFTEGGEIS